MLKTWLMRYLNKGYANVEMSNFSGLWSLEDLNLMSEKTVLSILTIVQCHYNDASCLRIILFSFKAFPPSLFNVSLEITKRVLALIYRIFVCLFVLGKLEHQRGWVEEELTLEDILCLLFWLAFCRLYSLHWHQGFSPCMINYLKWTQILSIN